MTTLPSRERLVASLCRGQRARFRFRQSAARRGSDGTFLTARLFGRELVDKREWHEYRKTETIFARWVDGPVEVQTPQGTLTLEEGGYVACSSQDPDHVWPITADVFRRSYERVGAVSANRAEATLGLLLEANLPPQ